MRGNNLSFSEILKEPSIEDHPAIYWAIVKRPSPDDYGGQVGVFARWDQALFQCLRRSPKYGALSGADRMLLSVSAPPTIDVEELPGQDGPFAVRHSIVQFEKRMKVSGEVAFEFIARGTPPRIRFPSPRPTEYHFAYLCSPLGRIWTLRFYVKRDDSTHQPGP